MAEPFGVSSRFHKPILPPPPDELEGLGTEPITSVTSSGNTITVTGAAPDINIEVASGLYLPVNNPTATGTVNLTGASTVTVPTVGSPGDNTTNAASTAFVQAAIALGGGGGGGGGLSSFTSPDSSITIGGTLSDPTVEVASGVFLKVSNNLSDLASVSTARTNLGLGTAAVQNVAAFLQASNNLSDLASASTARTHLGLGTAATQNLAAFAQAANNLSDLASVAAARGNIGLGSGTPTGSGVAVLQTSPELVSPTAQSTPAAGDSSLALATTAFVTSTTTGQTPVVYPPILNPQGGNPSGYGPPTAAPSGFSLVFTDDFPGSSLSTVNWFEYGGQAGAGNYAWYVANALAVSGSVLTITSKIDNNGTNSQVPVTGGGAGQLPAMWTADVYTGGGIGSSGSANSGAGYCVQYGGADWCFRRGGPWVNATITGITVTGSGPNYTWHVTTSYSGTLPWGSGQSVVLSGITPSTMNGVYIISSITGANFTISYQATPQFTNCLQPTNLSYSSGGNAEAATGSAVNQVGAALMWPSGQKVGGNFVYPQWPSGQEIDFYEDAGSTPNPGMSMTFHYSSTNQSLPQLHETTIDATLWNIWSVRWMPGKLVYLCTPLQGPSAGVTQILGTMTNSNIQAPSAMWTGFQVEKEGSGAQPTSTTSTPTDVTQVDWAALYSYIGPSTPPTESSTVPIPEFLYYPQITGVTASGAMTANYGYCTPFIVSQGYTFTSIGMNLTRAGTGGTPVMRFAIFADNGAGYPGMIVADYGTVGAVGTGPISIAINQFLEPGLYWAACSPQNSGAFTQTPEAEMSAASLAPFGMSGFGSASTINTGFVNTTTADFPTGAAMCSPISNTWPGGSSLTQVPLVQVGS